MGGLIITQLKVLVHFINSVSDQTENRLFICVVVTFMWNKMNIDRNYNQVSVQKLVKKKQGVENSQDRSQCKKIREGRKIEVEMYTSDVQDSQN